MRLLLINPNTTASMTEKIGAAAEAVAALGRRVALVLDAGPAHGGVPSTVVRVDEDRVTILRPGAIHEADIRETAKQAL